MGQDGALTRTALSNLNSRSRAYRPAARCVGASHSMPAERFAFPPAPSTGAISSTHKGKSSTYSDGSSTYNDESATYMGWNSTYSHPVAAMGETRLSPHRTLSEQVSPRPECVSFHLMFPCFSIRCIASLSRHPGNIESRPPHSLKNMRSETVGKLMAQGTGDGNQTVKA